MSYALWYIRAQERRALLGLTEAEVLRGAGLNKAFFANHRAKPDNVPGLRSLTKLARALRCDVAYFSSSTVQPEFGVYAFGVAMSDDSWAPSKDRRAIFGADTTGSRYHDVVGRRDQ
jgi:transcriptional regulator with XRE-family HTH domain